MIKIIFCDMDGTLLTSEKKLPEGFDELISLLNERGIIFAPTSGRSYASLLKMFPKYAQDFLFLSDNGTLATYKGKRIFSQPIERDTAIKILRYAESIDNVLRVLCGEKNYILAEQNRPYFTERLEKFSASNAVVNAWEEIDDEPLKISFCDPTKNSAVNVYPFLAPFYDSMQVVLASDEWTDVTALGASKGAGVQAVQKLLGIAPKECAAFGDYMNDYEMLESVVYSFAMANAHPDLKRIARYETLSNDEDGVGAGIKKLLGCQSNLS
ncbi:MAG: HAD family phosphatase [Selenomonadaceae bacterium]|nr:HAD family phosphatase [Selenomonadaceae bacterium]